MEMYVGTKTLFAKPMTLGEYNLHRGWTIPDNENPEALGYLVEYDDGYQSWSPKKQFEEAYKSNGNFSFGHAMWLIERKKLMARSGWNGKDMFIFKVNGSVFTVDREPLISILGRNTMVEYHSHIDMKTATGEIIPWLCSQADMQAHDWMLVPSFYKT